MKKQILFPTLLVLLTLCGCTGGTENTDNRFLMDTVLSLSADCSSETLAAALDRCAAAETEFSRTADGAVAQLNAGETVHVSDGLCRVLQRAVYYGDLTGGRFDITVCPVSSLWDFENQVVPDRAEIAAALANVDYHSIEITGNTVCLHGKQIDLGGIAKGYIAAQTADYLQQNGATHGTVSFGSSIVIFGKQSRVAVRDPFCDTETVATVSVRDACVSTSGTYERCFDSAGVHYHHILDVATGYGVESDLVSATVIGKNATDGDALSTICILYGRQEAMELIESLPDTEAVLVDAEGELFYTSGLTLSDGILQCDF